MQFKANVKLDHFYNLVMIFVFNFGTYSIPFFPVVTLLLIWTVRFINILVTSYAHLIIMSLSYTS